MTLGKQIMLRAVLDIIRPNLGLKVVATLAAIGLWFYVMNTENPIRREVRAAEVTAVGAPDGLAVARVRPESLQVTLSGRLSGLSREQLEHLSVVADMAGAHEGRNEVPVHVLGIPARVALAGLERETVQVWLERETSRRMAVSVVCTGEPAEGYALTGPAVARPEGVGLSGPESLVARVARVVARLDVTGLRSRQTVSVTVEARDADGERLRGVTMVPDKVDVTASLAADESRQVPVRLRLGTVTGGRTITDTRVVPGMVSLRGTESTLAGVTEVPTQRLTVSHTAGVREYRVPLDLPRGTWLPDGESTVTVRVTVGTDRAAPPTARPRDQETSSEEEAGSRPEPDETGEEITTEAPRATGGDSSHVRPGTARPGTTSPTQPGAAEGDGHHPAPVREEATTKESRP